MQSKRMGDDEMKSKAINIKKIALTHLLIHFRCTVSVLAVEVVVTMRHSTNKLRKRPL